VPAPAVTPPAPPSPPAAVALPPQPVAPPPPSSTVPENVPSLTAALLQHAAPQAMPASSTSPASPANPELAAPVIASESVEPPIPIPTFENFSKEIDALFASPQSPNAAPVSSTATKPDPVPASSTPSTQELKVHASELQAKLSALLFTEAPPLAQPTHPAPEPPKESAPAPAEGLASKLLALSQEETKSAAIIEFEVAPESEFAFAPAPAPPKPFSAALSADDEVKIPAWLAPLSQNSELPASESAASGDFPTESDSEIPSLQSAETHAGSAHRSEASVFGGQLLGESPQVNPPSGRSKSGLLFALAAAAILITLAAAWYFLYGPGAASNNATRPVHASSMAQGSGQTTPPQSPSAASTASSTTLSTQALNKVNPSSAASVTAAPLLSKSPSVGSSPAVFNPAPERKVSNPPSGELAPVTPPEPEKKSSLGTVRLAAPVVNRGDASQSSADVEPSIESSVSTSGADALASNHNNAPSVPLPVGGDVKPAQLIKSVPPVYPAIAKTQHISGNVQIDALVDTSGKVAEVKVISGPSLLHRAALDAVKQWKYSPALLDGQPTSMHLTVVVQFHAQ
jgi:periplasmic protein TonB